MNTRLLIVGNLARARASLHALLGTASSFGEIREARINADGLALIETFKPDLVIVDVKISDQDAVLFVRQVKKRSPETLVMMIAMYREWEPIARFAGADAFVDKGKSPLELLDTVNQLAGIGVSAACG